MTNNIPEISFITICYNGFKDTCELIESLQNKIHSIRYETIVVDNASREDEAAKIRERYPSVIAIRSNENKGFSGGNNIGIREAKGKYIFLINNDTYIEQDTISFLIATRKPCGNRRCISQNPFRFSSSEYTIRRVHSTDPYHTAQCRHRFRLSGQRDIRHPTSHPLSAWGSYAGETRSD